MNMALLGMSYVDYGDYGDYGDYEESIGRYFRRREE